MTSAESRRLLLDWLKSEEPEGRRLAALLAELAERGGDIAPLARYLAIKEKEEKALLALAERERWHRSFSWRMVTALFTFGIVSLVVFVTWGGEPAFLAAIFFFAGGTTYYLLAQAMASWSGRRDRGALASIRDRCRKELEELRREVGG
ncbi:MAG: hypothetical protein ACRD4D_08225 [Candidatus Acidiferrales bacterium]